MFGSIACLFDIHFKVLLIFKVVQTQCLISLINLISRGFQFIQILRLRSQRQITWRINPNCTKMLKNTIKNKAFWYSQLIIFLNDSLDLTHRGLILLVFSGGIAFYPKTTIFLLFFRNRDSPKLPDKSFNEEISRVFQNLLSRSLRTWNLSPRSLLTVFSIWWPMFLTNAWLCSFWWNDDHNCQKFFSIWTEVDF